MPRRTELTDILKSKDKDMSLNEKVLVAFNTAKQAIANYTKLNYLSSDPFSILILSTDASDSAVGAVLQQPLKGKVTPISFFYVKLKDTEKRYSTFGRKLLAIYLAIRHFRHFLKVGITSSSRIINLWLSHLTRKATNIHPGKFVT